MYKYVFNTGVGLIKISFCGSPQKNLNRGRSSKINKKRRHSSSSLKCICVDFCFDSFGFLVYYLNKNSEIFSINRIRGDPQRCEENTNTNDNDENVADSLINSDDELNVDNIIIDVGDGITENVHDEKDSESVLTWTTGPGANISRVAETTETEPVAEQEGGFRC